MNGKIFSVLFIVMLAMASMAVLIPQASADSDWVYIGSGETTTRGNDPSGYGEEWVCIGHTDIPIRYAYVEVYEAESQGWAYSCIDGFTIDFQADATVTDYSGDVGSYYYPAEYLDPIDGQWAFVAEGAWIELDFGDYYTGDIYVLNLPQTGYPHNYVSGLIIETYAYYTQSLVYVESYVDDQYTGGAPVYLDSSIQGTTDLSFLVSSGYHEVSTDFWGVIGGDYFYCYQTRVNGVYVHDYETTGSYDFNPGQVYVVSFWFVGN